MATDPLVLARARLFPSHGLPIHVNRPIHQGDTPFHNHDFLEIAVVCSGRGMHRSTQELRPVTPGDVVILQPGQCHAWERCRDLHLANCILGGEVVSGPLAWLHGSTTLAPILGPGQEHGPLMIHLPPAGLKRIIATLDLLRGHKQNDDLQRVGHLLIALGELATAIGPTLMTTSHPNPAVTTAMARMRERIEAPWTLAAIAARANVTPSYLVRLFRRFTGHTPMEWLARQRLERVATLLLTTDLPLARIALDVGWRDPTHLVRRFRAYRGQTPGAYRRQLPVAPAPIQAEAWIQW